jgi:hypothetical protein
MTNRPPPGKCVYCLTECASLTWDHIFPISWYPKSSSTDEKWKVPVCNDCNNGLSRIEGDLRNELALCLDPTTPSTQEIVQKALSSFDPKMGRDQIDRKIRQKRLEKLIGKVTLVDKVPKNVLPNFGLIPGLSYPNGFPVLHVRQEDVYTLVNKIVRGLTYISNGVHIDENHRIDFYSVQMDVLRKMLMPIKNDLQIFDHRPGIYVAMGTIVGESINRIFFIEIWEKLNLQAFVLPKDYQLSCQ